MDFLFVKFVNIIDSANHHLALIDSCGDGKMDFGVWVTYPKISSWNFSEMRAAREKQDNTYITVSFISQEHWTPTSYVAGYTTDNDVKWHDNSPLYGSHGEKWDKLTTLVKTYEQCTYYDEPEPDSNDNPLIEEINKRYWKESKVAVVTIQDGWLDKQLLTIYNS